MNAGHAIDVDRCFVLQIKERDETHRREEIAQEEIEVRFDA
jgi:hypothetical protein